MCVFFSSRRRHTRYWRDWSSDVCSSDLRDTVLLPAKPRPAWPGRPLTMRIAYVAGTALPSRVASAVNILKMCRSFAAAGHEVTLYARGRQADAAGVFAAYGLDHCFGLVLRAPPGLRLAKNLLYPAQVARE